VSSIVALALGIVLAVGVNAFFSLIGWGGEWASQTAGAASGAAPLISARGGFATVDPPWRGHLCGGSGRDPARQRAKRQSRH